MSEKERSSIKRTRKRRQRTGDVPLGDRVRKFRTQLGLSQEQLAQRIERSEGWLIDVENGRADPSYSDLLNISGVLKQHVSQFLPDAPTTAIVSPHISGPLDLAQPIEFPGVGVPSGILDF